MRVGKAEVWDEVAKQTAYIGDKTAQSAESADGADMYDTVLLTDADAGDLERFWEEAAAVADGHLREMLQGRSVPGAYYEANLRMSDGYDSGLNVAAERALRGYFVAALAARWCRLAIPAKAEEYEREAAQMMTHVLTMLYSRKRPVRADKVRN